MIPRDPSSCRGWMRLSCRPAFQQTVRTSESYYDIERDALSGAYLSPVRCNAVRSSEGATASKRVSPSQRTGPWTGSRVNGLSTLQPYGDTLPRATAGSCPPLRCYRARGRMGARVMASGMPGASRRAVLGGATYSVVKVWIRLSGAGRPQQRHRSAPHPWRASSAGVSILDLVPAGSAPCPIGLNRIGRWGQG